MNIKVAIDRYFQQQKQLFGNELYLLNHPLICTNSELKTELAINGQELKDYKNLICNCQKCPLGSSRTNFVFGSGDPDADLLLIGEAPGKHEDLQGEPFVGRAGKLLDDILKAIQKKRGDGVYIANVLKCRPPNNRDPLPSEVEECEPFLMKQINLIKPKLIVALGRVAGKTLLKLDVPLKEMREKTFDYNGTPLRVTYHPAALLRNSNLKKPAWIDFQWIQAYLQTA